MDRIAINKTTPVVRLVFIDDTRHYCPTMKYFCGTTVLLAAVILQRRHAVADENDGRHTVEKSLHDELSLLLSDNAEFDVNYRGDYSIELVSACFHFYTLAICSSFHCLIYTHIKRHFSKCPQNKGNWENDESDDSLDEYMYEDEEYMYEDEYDNDRRAMNETYDDYEDGDILDYYELPLQSAITADNERHLAADCNANEQYFKLVLKTDNYGFEESWTLMKREEDNGAWVMFATGPEEDTIYKDNKTYTGGENTTSLRSNVLLLCICDHTHTMLLC